MEREVADAVLYERWQTARDDRAFAQLARRHGPTVHDIAARALGDRAAAEDILQEALLDLALERSDKPAEVGIAAWLVRFAICKARNRRQSELSRARRQRVVGSRRPEEAMPDRTLEHSEELEFVMGRAEPEERAILAMRFLHGWSHVRIAGALGISAGAARVRVHRALRAVRSRVTDRPVASRVVPVVAPVAALAPSTLDSTIDQVLQKAHLELGTAQSGAVGASEAPRVLNRLGGLGSTAGVVLVGLVLAGSTGLVLRGTDATGTRTDAVLAWGAAAPVGVVGATSVPSVAGHPAFESGVPRPADWDRGVLGRVGRGEVLLDDVARAPVRPESSEDPVLTEPPTPEVPVPTQALAERPSETSRPIVREACAARCDLDSSEGERAGVSGGPVATPRSWGTRESEEAGPSAPEIPKAAVAPRDVDQPETVARPTRTVFDLDDAELALVRQAAEILQPLVGDELADAELAEPRAVQKTLRRKARRLQRKYRRERHELSRAVRTGDTEAARIASAKAVRYSAVSDVLGFLVDVLSVNSDAGSQTPPRLPAGIDVSAALTNVIDVLSDAADRAVAEGEGELDPARLPEFLFR